MMPRMGRPRQTHRSLPPGFQPKGGKWYFRATSAATREIMEKLSPGKNSLPVGTTPAEARAWWTNTVLPLMDKAEPNQVGTVNEIMDRAEADIETDFRSESGKEGARRYIKEIRKEFGDRPYAKTEVDAFSGKKNYLRDTDITAYLYRNKNRKSISNKVIRELNRCFINARRRWGLTAYNPAAHAQYHVEEPRDAYMDDATFRKLRSVASPALQCMMDIAQMTGIRQGMIFDIRLDDIKGEEFMARPNKIRSERKRGKKKPYIITDELREVFDKALELRKSVRGGQSQLAELGSAYLFLTRNGKPYTKESFKRVWKTARDAAGFLPREFTFHDIRAKAGSDASGEREAQELLGHEDAATTRRVYRRKVSPATPLGKVGS